MRKNSSAFDGESIGEAAGTVTRQEITSGEAQREATPQEKLTSGVGENYGGDVK